MELDPYKVVMQAIDNVRPTIDFQHIRKGTVGQVIVVPKPIEETRAIDYAFRWIIEATQTPDVTKEFAITKGNITFRYFSLQAYFRSARKNEYGT